MDILKKVKKLMADGKEEEADKVFQDYMDSEVKGLKTKNEELLGKLKEEKESRKEMNNRLTALEEEKQKIEEEKVAKSGDIEKVKQTLQEKFNKEIKAKNDEITKKDGLLKTHIINEGLTNALVKAKVNPNLMEAAQAMIQRKYQGEIGENDGKPFAKFDGKAVDQFVTEWAQTDAGKHFVTADGNSGGGSNGANGTGNASANNVKTMKRTEFDALSASDKSKISIEGVKLV